MRKEEIRSLIIYTILIAIALIVGMTAIRDAMQDYNIQMQPWLFVVICLVSAYVLNAIGHELLHMLGAVIGGYKVVSVNILYLCFENNGKKSVFHIKDFDGFTGETKIAPGKKQKKNLNLYMWFPIFGYATEIASCIVIISSAKSNLSGNASWLAASAVFFILVSSMMAFYELIPIRLDCKTDGYRMRLLSNPINAKAYNQMLEIQDKQRHGEVIKDVPVFDEITEYTAELNIVAMYHFLGKEDYKKSGEIIDILLKNENKLNTNDKYRLICQKLYIEILTKPLEEAKKLYDEIAPIEVRRFIANDISMESIRSYILIAGMIEGSEGEVKYALGKVEKAKKKTLESQKEVEEKLLKKAIEYVYKNHPKWQKEIGA